jgi:hypothetical protein
METKEETSEMLSKRIKVQEEELVTLKKKLNIVKTEEYFTKYNIDKTKIVFHKLIEIKIEGNINIMFDFKYDGVEYVLFYKKDEYITTHAYKGNSSVNSTYDFPDPVKQLWHFVKCRDVSHDDIIDYFT